MNIPDLPYIIDIEASGFGPRSYPIEIGLALDEGRKYCALITPAPGWTYWDEEAQSIHRVARDILETYGKPLEVVATELNTLLQDEIVYTDGWVVDKPWLLKLYHQCRIEPTFSTRALEFIMSEQQLTVWQETQEQVMDELNLQRHRASYDAYIIQQTWLRSRDLVNSSI